MLKIVSGGQTGVDRAALKVATEKGIPYGGWCPKGGWAEDWPEPPGILTLYPGLRETPEATPEQRTEWNVRDSDRLMVLTNISDLTASKGTALALKYAKTLGKPTIVIDLEASGGLADARAWLAEREDSILCIAGPRESEAPGIAAEAHTFLTAVLTR
jgi:hypothetical protein